MKVSEFDLFDLVLNELSRIVEERDKKYLRLKVNNSERYKDNQLGVNVDDNAVLVYADKEERLDFAKRVANAYDCDYKIIRHENAPEGGEYECKIFIS